MAGRRAGANPFEGARRGRGERSVKYCAWEVLADFPEGLNVTQIAREIQDRGLKDFSEKKNAAGQVSGDLVRGKDVFWHDPDKKLWWIWPMAPVAKGKARRKARGAKPRGEALVGCRASVWWGGEGAFFGGRIGSYDAGADRYEVVYDDGDADPALEFREYDVTLRAGKVDVVTVTATDQDDADLASAEGAADGKEAGRAVKGRSATHQSKASSGKQPKALAGSQGKSQSIARNASTGSAGIGPRLGKRAQRLGSAEAGIAESPSDAVEPSESAVPLDRRAAFGGGRAGRRLKRAAGKRGRGGSLSEDDHSPDARRSKRGRTTWKAEGDGAGYATGAAAPAVDVEDASGMDSEGGDSPGTGGTGSAGMQEGHWTDRHRRTGSPVQSGGASPPSIRHGAQHAAHAEEGLQAAEELSQEADVASGSERGERDAPPGHGEAVDGDEGETRVCGTEGADAEDPAPVRKSRRLRERPKPRDGEPEGGGASDKGEDDEMSDLPVADPPSSSGLQDLKPDLGGRRAPPDPVRPKLEETADVKVAGAPGECGSLQASGSSSPGGRREHLVGSLGGRSEPEGERVVTQIGGSEDDGDAMGGAVSVGESSEDEISIGHAVEASETPQATDGEKGDGGKLVEAKAEEAVTSKSEEPTEGGGAHAEGLKAAEPGSGVVADAEPVAGRAESEVPAAAVTEQQRDGVAPIAQGKPSEDAQADPKAAKAADAPVVCKSEMKRSEMSARRRLARSDPFMWAPRMSERGPSLETLKLTRSLVMRSKLPSGLPRLGDVTELMSVSQLSEELKSVGGSEAGGDRGDSEISSAPPEGPGPDVRPSGSLGLASSPRVAPESASATVWEGAEAPPKVEECTETPGASPKSIDARVPDGMELEVLRTAPSNADVQGVDVPGSTAPRVADVRGSAMLETAAALGSTGAHVHDSCLGSGPSHAAACNGSSFGQGGFATRQAHGTVHDGQAQMRLDGQPTGGALCDGKAPVPQATMSQASGDEEVGAKAGGNEGPRLSMCGGEAAVESGEVCPGGDAVSGPLPEQKAAPSDISLRSVEDVQDGEGRGVRVVALEDSARSVVTCDNDRPVPVGNESESPAPAVGGPPIVQSTASRAGEPQIPPPAASAPADEQTAGPLPFMAGKMETGCGAAGQGHRKGLEDRKGCPEQSLGPGAANGEMVAESGLPGEADAMTRTGESDGRAGGHCEPRETQAADRAGRICAALSQPHMVRLPG